MKPAHYIEKVKKSTAYKLLMDEDPKAFLCSVFFLRDFDEGNNQTQVDFYSPKKKHIISFKADGKIERTEGKKFQTLTKKKLVPTPLSEKIKMDVDAMKSTLLDEMHNRDMTYEIEKMLVFLNNHEGKAVWNCTGFLKGLGLIQAHVEDQTASILFMEKKSLFDMIKFAGGNMPGGGPPGLMAPVNPMQLAGKPMETKNPIKIDIVKDAPKKEEVKKDKSGKKK